MFLNDCDLDLGFLRGFPLTIGAKKRKNLLLKRLNSTAKTKGNKEDSHG
ncbi:hypothetical protein X925_03610 [Petrotoga sp. 9T1HF07.CasAA.8.2]|nr:hypothetical protein X925_03610 [Petrotoga sp. 9T1HF07.CasAA.8.2]PNR93850.1 hypothetical protein X926_01940 [Petrotoga sp. HWHPT.55.6.3]